MQFEPIFKPKTVAVIGASDRPESVGYAVMKNMLNERQRQVLQAIIEEYISTVEDDCLVTVVDFHI